MINDATEVSTADVWLLQRSEGTGGTHRIIEELAKRLRAEGVTARGVFLRDCGEHRRAQQNKLRGLLAHFRDIGRLVRGIWREKPLLIVTFTPLLGALVGLVAKVTGRPCVVSTLHTHSQNIRRTVLWTDRLIARSGGYSKVVACGWAVAESYSDGGTPYPVRIEAIQNGVPLSDAQRQPGSNTELRLQAGIPLGRPVAFAAGRLVEEKNYLFLVRVLSVIEDWCLVIAGDGAARGEVEAEIKRLNLGARVRLLGLVNHEEVRQWLVECDAYVMPSVNEGLSLALLEAMASAAPILASNIPGNREALGDVAGEFGWLLQPDNQFAWAEALRKLRVKPQDGEAAGSRARTRQRLVFSEERMYSEYVELVQKVLKT